MSKNRSLASIAALIAVACASPMTNELPHADGVGVVSQALEITASQSCCAIGNEYGECDPEDIGFLIVGWADRDQQILNHAEGLCRNIDGNAWIRTQWDGCCVGTLWNDNGNLACAGEC